MSAGIFHIYIKNGGKKMKKIISVIVAAVMLASMIPAVVLADEVEYVSPGKIIVPYTSGEGVTIDGVLAQGEWSETNKIALNETNMVSWAGYTDPFGPIDFYYSWGDKGLYMAANVYDPDIEAGTSPEGGIYTRFQIALNPQEMIDETYAGLFFSIGPMEDTDNVGLIRHNWQTEADDSYFVDEESAAEDGFVGKYTYNKDGETVTGWTLECILPWKYIASEDRYADLDVDETLEDLTSFNPKNEDVTKAYLTATICYVKCDGATAVGTGRTCTDGNADNFKVDSYDVFLLLCPPGATERTLDVTPFAAAAPATSEGDTSAEDPGTTEADPGTTPDDTTKADDSQTTTEEEGKTTTAEPAATTNKPAEQGKKSNTGLIIGIVAGVVVVAAAAACGIILSKKNKK